MRRVILSMSVCVAAFLFIGAQKRPPATITINEVTFRLGMTKAEVSEKLVGTTVTKLKDDDWVLGGEKSVSPSFQFTNGRLTFVDQTWSKTDAVAGPLFGVINQFQTEGLTQCRIAADIRTDPDSSTQRAWIHCGEKHILIIHDIMNEKSYDWVSEQLGEYR